MTGTPQEDFHINTFWLLLGHISVIRGDSVAIEREKKIMLIKERTVRRGLGCVGPESTKNLSSPLSV